MVVKFGIFGYIVQRTNTKILSSHFLQFYKRSPKNVLEGASDEYMQTDNNVFSSQTNCLLSFVGNSVLQPHHNRFTALFSGPPG